MPNEDGPGYATWKATLEEELAALNDGATRCTNNGVEGCVFSSSTESFIFPMMSRSRNNASSALPCRHRIRRSSAYVTMRLPKHYSGPSFFHHSASRRKNRLASKGEMGGPCGMPRR